MSALHPEGQTLCILGARVRKTTMAHLLCRLYTLTPKGEGEITIGGVNINRFFQRGISARRGHRHEGAVFVFRSSLKTSVPFLRPRPRRGP
jgi:ABC-type multidrug transport system fused ATPase/permease subunit